MKIGPVSPGRSASACWARWRDERQQAKIRSFPPKAENPVLGTPPPRSPALPALCAITDSASASPKRTMRLPFSPPPPRAVRRRSSRHSARCFARPIPIGSASTRFLMRSGGARACGSAKCLPARRAKTRRRRRGGLPKRTCRKRRLAFPIASNGAPRLTATAPPKAAAAVKVLRAPKRYRSLDLRHIVDPDEVAATHALAARLARTMRARLVRREQVRRRGRRLDLRRTIHRNVSHGGTLIELAWRRRKDQTAAAGRAA